MNSIFKQTTAFILLLLAVSTSCYSQIETHLKIERKDFDALMAETGLKEMNTPSGSMLIDYKSDTLTTGDWRGEVSGIYFGYSELELHITQTQPVIKGTWKQSLPPDVDVLAHSITGEIIGKNDSTKILLILKSSSNDSTYYLEYFSGKCLTYAPGYQHDVHKHYFFGAAEFYPTLEYGYPGSYFWFRKEDRTVRKR